MCDIDTWEGEGGGLTSIFDDDTLDTHQKSSPSAGKAGGSKGLNRGPGAGTEDARGTDNGVGKSCIYTETNL